MDADKWNRKKLDELNDMSRQQTEVYLRRSSIGFLECAINLMATHMPLKDVADILEAEAKSIKELG
ncbi:hypothetical protein ATN84_05280 [Paramesorhizobium deserti]|uniref:Uncharacterized protein n=1 Tax=Paramesorhizobium deserti TaxID=1494590 RepID=A0A135I118_9HYPH|nr:hypothetical protein [Paramesorhizobium deserti]KXF79144.1 hypothetical protein ATN84_05280 [Paramesorhizobium deserti]